MFYFRLIRPALWTSVLFLFAISVYAQFGANLQGTVTDASGAVVPNARVTLTSNETQRQQTTTTSGDGFYRFNALAPGTYTLTAEAPGFSRQQMDRVVVNAEQSQGINITLQPGQVSETVTVSGDTAPVVQTENAQIGARSRPAR